MRYYRVTLLEKGKRRFLDVKATNKNAAKDIAVAKIKGAKALTAKECAEPFEEKIKGLFASISEGLKGKEQVKVDDLIPVFKQMSMMLGSGISIHQSIQEIIDFSDNQTVKVIFTEALVGINGGKTLTNAFRPYQDRLGNLVMSMIDLGEQTGNLAESLGMLSITLQEIRDNVSKFKKALRYPMFTVGAMVIAFVILIMLVVPKFKSIFAGLGANLPLPTIILLKIEYIFTNYGHLLLAFIVALIFGLRYLYKNNKKFHYEFDRNILKVNLIGRIIYLYSMNQYMITLSQMLKAGIPLEEALKSSANMVTNIHLKRLFNSITDLIRKGATLTSSFQETQLFERSSIQMVSAGEQSGNLDEMLGVAGNYYKMKYDNIVDNLSAYIEPIITAFIAGMVLLLALGIFMPMWDLASAAKGK